MQNNIVIPYISNRKIEVKVKKIRPITSKNKDKVYLGNFTITEARNSSFRAGLSKHAMEKVDFETLEVIAEVYTNHLKKGTETKFQPTLAEIYAQIPESLSSKAVAFECSFVEEIDDTIQKGKITLYGLKA